MTDKLVFKNKFQLKIKLQNKSTDVSHMTFCDVIRVNMKKFIIVNNWAANSSSNSSLFLFNVFKQLCYGMQNFILVNNVWSIYKLSKLINLNWG